MENPLSCQKITNYESSCTSAMENYFVKKKSYGHNNPNQMEHDYHLVIIMKHAYTPLSLVEGKEFHRIITHLDPPIQHITRSKLTRNLTPNKLNNAEKYVSSLLDGVSCVVI